MTTPRQRVPRGSLFPIVEAFGFPHDSTSPGAKETWQDRACPFVGNRCEKYVQYTYGYCSVTYAAEWDKGVPHTYAVCDHRLDGEPVDWVLMDHFNTTDVTVVPEVTAIAKPKLNIDFVAFKEDAKAQEGVDLVAIEAQAIDLRGGGVGPAWRAWEDGQTSEWRSYFSEAAKEKNRRDTIDYGVNVGNVYKRLGTQVAVKGEYFKQINVPLYVVAQHRILEQLRARVDFDPVPVGHEWDITFASFDYDGTRELDGRLAFRFREAVRTTLPNYLNALTSSRAVTEYLRSDFIDKVRMKSER
ncbi:hypothetical protein [Micromonospora sp. NPDC004704]